MAHSSHKPRSAAGAEIGYEGISGILRQEMLAGRWKANGRLPTRRELQQRFRTTSVTIQNALDVLSEQGFVRAAGRQGTFMAEHPPHLHHYALIFHSDPSDLEPGGWSHFHAALANEAAKIQQHGKRRLECFYGIHEPTESGQYQRLVAKMKAHQFAGLIFTSHFGRLLGTPLVELEGVPRVALMRPEPAFPKIPAVEFDMIAWFEKAFDYLASRGRKRVAFVSKPAPKSLIGLKCPSSLLSTRGLITRPDWNLPVPLWSEGAQHIIQLLMRSKEELPDALVITDDNLVEPAVAGLMAAGVRVPDDVEVVAHANFPRSGPRLLPLKWLGYDNHQVLQTCISIIDQQCRGKRSPVVTKIEPVFEEGLATRQFAAENSTSH